MVSTIVLKNELQTTTLLASHQTTENNIPTIFFTEDSFDKVEKPTWVTNKAPLRVGNFKHYNGSDDATMEMFCYLYGANKETDLATLYGLKDVVIYLETNGNFSTADGKYVITEVSPKRFVELNSIKVELQVEEYNN